MRLKTVNERWETIFPNQLRSLTFLHKSKDSLEKLSIYVMPARIAGDRLLLDHTDETASSEAAGQHRIQQRKLSFKPNGGGSIWAINSESRSN